MTDIQGVSQDRRSEDRRCEDRRSADRRRRDTLRSSAESRIKGGTAPSVGNGTLGVDALELLYRRASNPEFAADAIKLLHELQTHQVELDLLFEQLQSSESELTEELAHYRALYDLLPVPCLVMNTGGRVVERNRAAIALFGHRDARLAEHQFYDLLAPSSRTTVTAMMEALEASRSEQSCLAELAGDRGNGQYFTLKAVLGPSEALVVMTLLPTPAVPNS